MPLKLYVVHGSHPCAAVEKALQIKGLPYGVLEWPPPMHSAMQKVIFGARTVPALRNGSEKIVGSRAIMHRLDGLAAEPPLYPRDPEARARVEEADRWGDEQFQQIARDLIWPGMVARPEAMLGYGEGSRIPAPPAVLKAIGPVAARGAQRLNKTSAAIARRRLQELPAKFDTIDAWIADGTIGDVEHPNAADLQIFSTVRLLLTMGDVRPLLEGRPCAERARALFPEWAGELPAGAISAA
jgi:glutathione S-transferase